MIVKFTQQMPCNGPLHMICTISNAPLLALFLKTKIDFSNKLNRNVSRKYIKEIAMLNIKIKTKLELLIILNSHNLHASKMLLNILCTKFSFKNLQHFQNKKEQKATESKMKNTQVK